MNRTDPNNKFFIGTEVEKTPALNLTTLFIIGIQPIKEIKKALNRNIEHLYFGANDSFVSSKSFFSMIKKTIINFSALKITIDIPTSNIEKNSDSLIELIKLKSDLIINSRITIHSNIRKNLCLKIDGGQFGVPSEGIFTISSTYLFNRQYQTHWNEYSNDLLLD